MAWIGKPDGIFKLHDSNNFCGSFISTSDITEILALDESSLFTFETIEIDGVKHIDELTIHKAWASEELRSQYEPQLHNAKLSFDEIILKKLFENSLAGSKVEQQIKFERKKVDMCVVHNEKTLYIEFVGPSHFVPQYGYPRSPIDRQKMIEDYFGEKCVIWPYWIQRCSRNIEVLWGLSNFGLASVWSTKAFFGDFVFKNSQEIIITLTDQFKALDENGIGYMYMSEKTNKPIHPIIRRIQLGKESKQRLIPQGNQVDMNFWLPTILWDK
jgi:very-short-patch-repair endonuclease